MRNNKSEKILNYLWIIAVIEGIYLILMLMSVFISTNKDVYVFPESYPKPVYYPPYNVTKVSNASNTCYEQRDVVYESNSSDEYVKVRACKDEQGDYKIVIINFNRLPANITLNLNEDIRCLKDLETNRTYLIENNQINVSMFSFSELFLEAQKELTLKITKAEMNNEIDVKQKLIGEGK